MIKEVKKTIPDKEQPSTRVDAIRGMMERLIRKIENPPNGTTDKELAIMRMNVESYRKIIADMEKHPVPDTTLKPPLLEQLIRNNSRDSSFDLERLQKAVNSYAGDLSSAGYPTQPRGSRGSSHWQ